MQFLMMPPKNIFCDIIMSKPQEMKSYASINIRKLKNRLIIKIFQSIYHIRMLENNGHQVISVYHFSLGRKVEEQKCSSEIEVSKGYDE